MRTPLLRIAGVGIAGTALLVGGLTSTAGTAAPAAPRAASSDRAERAAAAPRFVFTDSFGTGTAPAQPPWSHRNPPPQNTTTCTTRATEPFKRSRSRSTDAVTPVGGRELRLLVKRRRCADGSHVHRTGQIGTENTFHLDPALSRRWVVSARMKVPKTSGNFSALWTRAVSGAGNPNEVDIVESFGADAACPLRTNFYRTYETDGFKRQVCLSTRAGVPRRPWAAFHTYTMVWRPGVSTVIKIDGRKVYEYGRRATPDNLSFVILSNLLNNGKRVRGGTAAQSDLEVAWVKALGY